MNEEIFQLWLACHTEEEIAGKMQDRKEKAKKYDRLMKIVWDDLGRAINNPRERSIRLGPQWVQNYQETVSFLIKCFPNQRLDNFNLPFLNKRVEDLSEEELVNWQLNVAQVRGCLDWVLKGKK